MHGVARGLALFVVWLVKLIARGMIRVVFGLVLMGYEFSFEFALNCSSRIFCKLFFKFSCPVFIVDSWLS